METGPIDTAGHGLAHRDRQGPVPDPGRSLAALLRGQELRVLDPLEVEVIREDDRRGHQRAGQRPAAGLVHPGQRPEAALTELALVVVDLLQSSDNHSILDGGHSSTNAFPTILSIGICPRADRESWEFGRLSPMTKTWSASTCVGAKSWAPRLLRYGSAIRSPLT